MFPIRRSHCKQVFTNLQGIWRASPTWSMTRKACAQHDSHKCTVCFNLTRTFSKPVWHARKWIEFSIRARFLESLLDTHNPLQEGLNTGLSLVRTHDALQFVASRRHIFWNVMGGHHKLNHICDETQRTHKCAFQTSAKLVVVTGCLLQPITTIVDARAQQDETHVARTQ